MHLIHRAANGQHTDITMVQRNLTFSRIIDSKLATIDYTIREETTVSQFQQIVNNATSFENDMFLMMSEYATPQGV